MAEKVKDLIYKDLTYLVDCWAALREEVWAYFFMRGCEGYNNDRPNSPRYRDNPSAHRWYFAGYTYMEELDPLDYINDGIFCRAFLSGKPLIKPGCKISDSMGVAARLHFEKTWESLKKTQKGTPAMADKITLYRVKNQDIYGTAVGKDSLRRTILEIRGGNGQLKAFAEEELEEVMPYTISVRARRDATNSAIATEGEFSIGDVLLLKDECGAYIVDVTAINTKNKNPDFDIKDELLTVLFSKKLKDTAPTSPADPAS